MDLLKERVVMICFNDPDELNAWLKVKLDSKYIQDVLIKYGRLYSFVEVVHNPIKKIDIELPQRFYYVHLTGYDGSQDLRGGEGVFGASGLQAHALFLVDGTMTANELNYLQTRIRFT